MSTLEGGPESFLEAEVAIYNKQTKLREGKPRARRKEMRLNRISMEISNRHFWSMSKI